MWLKHSTISPNIFSSLNIILHGEKLISKRDIVYLKSENKYSIPGSAFYSHILSHSLNLFLSVCQELDFPCFSIGEAIQMLSWKLGGKDWEKTEHFTLLSYLHAAFAAVMQLPWCQILLGSMLPGSPSYQRYLYVGFCNHTSCRKKRSSCLLLIVIECLSIPWVSTIFSFPLTIPSTDNHRVFLLSTYAV